MSEHSPSAAKAAIAALEKGNFVEVYEGIMTLPEMNEEKIKDVYKRQDIAIVDSRFIHTKCQSRQKNVYQGKAALKKFFFPKNRGQKGGKIQQLVKIIRKCRKIEQALTQFRNKQHCQYFKI